ncbi:MAG: putative toxin-antitoxin system toxin component, PIN family [Chloroflexi bacterium]|nr:putative toxin-antitoxin system toxin component, PIN family [Chloroflexota bacterium]
MRVVMDTNVVVSRFLSPRGTPALVFEQWVCGAFELVVTEPILSEYQKALSYKRVQARHGMSVLEIVEVIDGLRSFAVLVESGETVQVVKDDPEDDKFLDRALAGEATYIISGDSHLLTLQEYKSIQILSPAMFLAVLEHQGR